MKNTRHLRHLLERRIPRIKWPFHEPIRGSLIAPMKRENCEIFNDSDREGLFARVSEFISEIAERSIAARGVFLFGYSGGSSASFFEKFKFSSVSSAWHLFPVDERVECGEAETNYFAI